MKFIKIITMAFLAALMFGGLAPAAEGDVSPYTMTLLGESSKEDLVAFLEAARGYALENGLESALEAFGDPDGEFVRGDLYVFAYDYDGVLLAHPFLPALVGRNNLDLEDPNGMPMIVNMILVAKRGGGFVYNVYPNPAHENVEELKLVYVLPVDDGTWIGSGIYLEARPPRFTPEARDNLTKFVKEARDYALERGRKEAFRAFSDPEGEFFQGDLYVYAYDYDGVLLAHPTQPHLIGTDRSDAKDANGVAFILDLAGLARTGEGLTYFLYPNPGMNMTDDLKLGCVMKVDEDWWLGSGIYASGIYASGAPKSASMGASTEKPADRVELAAYVGSAVEHAREVGKDVALADFMDLEGPWVRDEVYVFAHDFNGTALALPYLPDKVGTYRLDLQNAEGVYIVRDMRAVAQNTSGFYEYSWRNPVTNESEDKVSFVTRVDETWWLGAGIYG